MSMKRKEDPKRVAAQLLRLRAEIWLNILQKGIAAELEHAEFYRESEEIAIIVGHAKGDLMHALEKYRAAAQACELYRWRRPRRISRLVLPKTKAAAKKAT